MAPRAAMVPISCSSTCTQWASRELGPIRPKAVSYTHLETAFAGELLRINAFDQPGVEGGKQATYALLGKRGYDEKRAELAAMPAKKKEYII